MTIESAVVIVIWPIAKCLIQNFNAFKSLVIYFFQNLHTKSSKTNHSHDMHYIKCLKIQRQCRQILKVEIAIDFCVYVNHIHKNCHFRVSWNSKFKIRLAINVCTLIEINVNVLLVQMKSDEINHLLCDNLAGNIQNIIMLIRNVPYNRTNSTTLNVTFIVIRSTHLNSDAINFK